MLLKWIIIFLCIAILSRLGGCLATEYYSPRERLDILEKKIDILLERK